MKPRINPEDHISLAKWVANQYPRVDFDDAVQEACLALLRAVERFDPSRGVTFSSFATPALHRAVQRFAARFASPAVTLPYGWRSPRHRRPRHDRAAHAVPQRVLRALLTEAASPEDRLIAADLAKHVLVRLNATERRIIRLTVYGSSPEEIAQRLDMTIPSVRTTLYEARRKARKIRTRLESRK